MSDLLRFSSTPGGSTGASSEAGGIGGVSPGPAGPGVGREETQAQELVSGEDLLKEIEAVVERLKTIYSQTSKPLTDDTIEVSRFCRYLESILRHGQKEKLSFWGERKDYYHYITENLSSLKNFEQIVKRVQGLSEIVSSQGKGRALVRLCLNEQLLADCVQTSISNVKKTKDWYQSGAVLLIPSLTERLISALYDLYDVTFSLPVDGLDLDDAWPSFIQKSFSEQSPRRTSNGGGGGGGGGGGVSGLLKKALVTREAKSIDKSMLYKEEYTLERAIEEEPSEIFVRHEVPFDLSLVGSLLEEIRTLLVDEFEGYSHMTNLPSIKVKQLDDISSGLSLLKDYVSTMSSDVTKSMDKRNRLVHQLRQQVFKLEKELKAEQGKAKDFEEEAQSKESDLASTSLQLQVTSDEKRKFWLQVVEQREQISALKEEIAQLQEDKSNMAATPPPPSDTEMKQTIKELDETKLQLSSMESTNSTLSLQLEEERKRRETLENTIRKLKDSHESEIMEASLKLSSNQEEIERLNNVLGLSQEELREKDSQLSLCRTEFSDKTRELEEELKTLGTTREELEKERDSAIEEVKSMQGLVEQETASLRFQLSTTNIQLQQNNESYSKREVQLTELKDQVQQLSDQLTQTRGSLYQKEEANEELRQQLAISDTRWQSLQEEMKSLNEQLTEKTLNRDAVREQSLKKEREWDDQRERMTKEMQRLSGFSTKMSQENEELRKAIQRLLAQKVSLWQHADELEQEQVAKGQWLDSRDVMNCMGCESLFSMFNRKHHCRSCGKVFCGNCCSHKAQLPSNKDPVRVCVGCYGKIETLRTPQASLLVNPIDEDSVAVKPTLSNPDTIPGGGEPTTNMTNHINSFPGGVSLNSFLDGSDEPLLSHLRNDGRGSGTHNGKLFSSSQQSSMENSVEYCVEPLLKDDRVEGGEIGGKAITYTVSATDLTAASDPDDEFCVIETMSTKSDNIYPFGTPDSRLDVTALQAKLSKLETGQGTPGGSRRDPSSSSTPRLNRLDDSERDGSVEASSVIPGTPGSVIREVSDMEVEGGKTHTVTVMVRTPRTVVLWQFNSQPKGIAVGLKYQESNETETQVEVLPLRRVMSHKTVLTGEYVAQKAGIYTLIFSNGHSKFSGRVLSYKVWTRAPS